MLSVIIPSYNAAPFLADALRSVFAQTRRPDEVIVVDDCSTDDTVAVARAFPVTVLSTEVNSGHATARNIGIRAAAGETIAWLDADDYWDPEHLEVVCGLLDRFPEAAVACSAVRYTGAGSAGCVWTPDIAEERPVDAFWPSVRKNMVPAMSAVTRREPMLAVGGFNADVRVAPDFDLWLRMARRHPFVATRRVTSNYRQHEGQISRNPDRQLLSLYQARHRYWEAIREREPAEFVARFGGVVQAIWEEDLGRAWHTREFAAFRTRLAWGQYVPGAGGPRFRKWRLRGRVPAWPIRAADHLRRLRATASDRRPTPWGR